MKTIPYAFIATLALIWVGVITWPGLSEAPLSFHAIGLTALIDTESINMGFHPVTDLEIMLFLMVLACNFFSTRKKINLLIILFIGSLLAVQICYLTPKTNAEILFMQPGSKVAPSHFHYYFFGCQALKILLLLILSTRVILSIARRHLAGNY